MICTLEIFATNINDFKKGELTSYKSNNILKSDEKKLLNMYPEMHPEMYIGNFK